MAQNWDYAELSKAAKAAGGPEKYVDMLEQASKDAGKMEMLPWLGVAAVGASLLTAATIKVVDYFKSKKKKNEAEIAKAKEEIINGIKDYRTTLLSGETDPNKLYDLIATMEGYQVYSNDHVEKLVDLYLNGAERDMLDPILDACTVVYKNLDTEDQIKFKSSAKAFCRTYGFLGAILPYGDAEWEKLSIFLNLLIPKLPSPRNDDFSEGI